MFIWLMTKTFFLIFTSHSRVFGSQLFKAFFLKTIRENDKNRKINFFIFLYYFLFFENTRILLHLIKVNRIICIAVLRLEIKM